MNYRNTKEFLLFQKPKYMILNFILFIVAIVFIYLFFFLKINKTVSSTGVVTCDEEKCLLTTRVILERVEDILDFGEKIEFSKETINLKVDTLSPLGYDENYTYQFQDISFLLPKRKYEENRLYEFKIILNKEPIYKQIFKNI